jgi:peptide/nickel transport system substrate-binding protein
LTYVIPADAPPSFDAHREGTFATVYSAAPFYSVLIRVDPNNPSSTTGFVCDLCTEMPTPTDGGKTYAFKIRDGVKFHDGSSLSADDVAASWNKIIDPPEGVSSARQSHYMMVDRVEALNRTTVDSSLENRRQEESNKLQASGGKQSDDLLNGFVGAVVSGFEFAGF